MCLIEKGRQYARSWHYVLEIQIVWDTNISYGK
jgi:hypothetical protein